MSEASKIGDVELDTVEEILNVFHEESGNIINVLQAIQKKYGYLPRHVLSYVSNKLSIPLSEIYSVATFYTQFSFEEKGKYVITCCDGTACHVKGAPLLIEFLETNLGIKDGQTTEDKLFSLETVACLGCCALAPVIIVNEKLYGHIELKKVKRIIDKIRKENKKEAEKNE